METFLQVYYNVRIAFFILLFIGFLLKVRVLPHAKVLLVILFCIGAINIYKLFHGETYGYYSFTAKSLFYCSVGLSCLGFYSINVLLPGWFNLSRVLAFVSFPVTIFLILLISVFCNVDFLLYNSLSESLDDISDYQVWIRIVILVMLWLQFLAMMFVPRLMIHHFKAPLWYDIYNVAVFGYILTFVVQVLKNGMIADFVQSLYLTIFLGVISYIELFTHIADSDRIKVTNHIKQDYDEFIKKIDINNMDYLQKNTNQFYKLEEMVMRDKVYVNPNLTFEDLIIISHLTARQLEQTLNTAGYASFNHFIAKCRVVALKELILQSAGKNILSLYTQVGFANRVSATKYFKMFVGKTPSDWYKDEKKVLYVS